MVGSAGHRVAFRVAITLYAAGLLGWLVLGVLPLHSAIMTDATSTTQTAIQYLFSAMNFALGLLLVVRRPDDIVPRLLGFALLGTAATFNLPSHRAFHILGNPWPVATAHFMFHIVSGVTYMWAVILFPDGRLPRQIRIGRRGQAACAVVYTALVALLCWRSSFLAHPQFFVIFFGVAVPTVGVTAQLLRLRDPRTTPTERRVARMLCAALLPAFGTALLWLGCRLVALLSSGATHVDALRWAERISTWFPVVFAVVPVVLFAAVLRYRLWDVDRWLTRVLVYGALVLLIAAAYVVAVLLGASLFGPDALWTMVLTLAVLAALIQPVRVWLRRWANRVVFGVSLDPQQALRSLTDGLNQATPAEELDRLTSVALHATRASAVRLWLTEDDQLLCAAAAPPTAGRDPVDLAAVGLREGAAFTDVARPLGEAVCCPVRHQGELLGLLGATTADGTGLSGKDRALLADLADHAGLLVHNAVLTVGLARHADRLAVTSSRLRRVRRRLVAAQDAERRRLERNLHDGAQQALVAALIDIRTGAATAPSTAAMAAESLSELLSADRPAVLDEVGLVAAVTRAATAIRRSGITVRVSGELDGRQPDPEVATAAYFCCVEALQNVAKYASARTVTVGIGVIDDDLIFTVTDDGVGFDVALADAAGGLRQLDERLAVVGGTLTVDTRIGAGTRITGRAPVASSSGALR